MGPIRRHLRAPLLAVLALVAMLAAAPSASAATLGCSPDARGTSDLSAWVPEMLAATNKHRASVGLAPLALDPTLSIASTWKARDLAVRGYFAHDDPAGSNGAPGRSPWQRLVDCGFTSGGARAENIAAGQQSGADFIRAWINSPGHRANIENASMRYVGFGVAQLESSRYRTYAVQMFSSEPGPAANRTPQGGGQDTAGGGGSGPSTDAGGARATTRVVAAATLTRMRCRSRLAVRGSCYVLTVRGRVVDSTNGRSARRRVVVSRRLANRRYSSIGVVRTSGAGTFTVRRVVRPPARGTRTWLLRNARIVRVAVTASGTARAAASVRAARVRV